MALISYNRLAPPSAQQCQEDEAQTRWRRAGEKGWLRIIKAAWFSDGEGDDELRKEGFQSLGGIGRIRQKVVCSGPVQKSVF